MGCVSKRDRVLEEKACRSCLAFCMFVQTLRCSHRLTGITDSYFYSLSIISVQNFHPKYYLRWSQWPSDVKQGSAGSNCECCVSSRRGLCDRPIPRPEESYRLWCVIMCDSETLRRRRPWPALGCCTRGKTDCLYTWLTSGLSSISNWSCEERIV